MPFGSATYNKTKKKKPINKNKKGKAKNKK